MSEKSEVCPLKMSNESSSTANNVAEEKSHIRM